jgi:hypothetical protein
VRALLRALGRAVAARPVVTIVVVLVVAAGVTGGVLVAGGSGNSGGPLTGITLTDCQSANITAIPVTKKTTCSGANPSFPADITFSEHSLWGGGHGVEFSIARWTGSGAPTRVQCELALVAQPLTAVSALRPGYRYCIALHDARIAVVTLTAATAAGVTFDAAILSSS